MFADDLATALTPDEAAFRRILTGQLSRYPRMAVQDLYKLIFQASRGSEHAVSDITAARGWLARELHELADGPPEPIVDPIEPTGRVIRLNLRPYLAAGGDLAGLLEAFVRTAREYRGTAASLHRYWRYAEQMAAAGLLPLAHDALRNYFAEMQAKGFPTVHHSAVYSEAYRPAYRIVSYEFLVRTRHVMPPPLDEAP